MDRLYNLADEGVRNARRAIMKRFFEHCKTAVLVKGHDEKLKAIVVSSDPEVGERQVDALSKGFFEDISENTEIKELIALHLHNLTVHEVPLPEGLIEIYVEDKLDRILKPLDRL